MKNRTYRYFSGQPLYPFGYGLSYSKFEFSNLQLSTKKLKARAIRLAVEADVHNTSQRDGDEVVELYLSFPKSTAAPIRALRGFTRVSVSAGATQHVRFTLDERDLSESEWKRGNRILAKVSVHRISVGEGTAGNWRSGTRKQNSVSTAARELLPDVNTAEVRGFQERH